LRACQTRLTPAPLGACYGPNQIRAAYGIQPLLNKGVTGAGRTIVIIDAYGSDTIVQDLAVFNSYFGLSTPTLNIGRPRRPSMSSGRTLSRPARRSISSRPSQTTTRTS
jgi:hypothetical protein